MSAGGLIGAVAFLLAAGAVPASALLAPRPGQPVAILHRSADAGRVAQAVGTAGGSLLSIAGRHVTVARAEDDGFASRLQRAGVWLVLDAAALRDCSEARLPAATRNRSARHALSTT